MITHFRKVTIIKIRKPTRKDINEEIQWFSDSLGLFGDRDKEKSKFRVFIELLKAAKLRQPLSSDEIAERSSLSRATVIHHLSSLIEQGIVISRDKRYFLRVGSLEELIITIRKDLDEVFKDLREMAEELDRELNLE